MNKIVAGVFFSLVIIALVFLLLVRTTSPFGSKNSSFSTDAEKEITRIEFFDGQKHLTLEKDGDNWLVDGKYNARKSSIFYVIKVLHEIKIKSPVSPELFDREITRKNVIPVRIKVYAKRNLLKSFLVYKTASNLYGNIMKMRERSKPFIVNVPGFEGEIGSAFNLNELFWQPYTVFNSMPSEIVSVDFDNISDTISSFSIKRSGSKFQLFNKNSLIAGSDSLILMRYISYFTMIPFEDWEFKLSNDERNQIENRDPLYRITLKLVNGKSTILTLWERILKSDGTTKTDSDRLYGKTQFSDELFIVRYFDIDPIIKRRSYFLHQ
jgi:hypothetical protein